MRAKRKERYQRFSNEVYLEGLSIVDLAFLSIIMDDNTLVNKIIKKRQEEDNEM